jgi:predicted GIY-YIG superfamily endonuclease
MNNKTWLSNNWCELFWSDWQDLNADAVKTVAAGKGVYRVINAKTDLLFYVGQTKHLKDRIRLLLATYKDVIPYLDPHVAAQKFWAYHREDGYIFKFSYAETPKLSEEERQGLEDMLLWKYSDESGLTATANHGRTHPWYSASSQSTKRIRGAKLDKPHEYQIPPPLKLHGAPHDRDWLGLKWSDFMPFDLVKSGTRALYRISVRNSDEILYIGQTTDIKTRANAHSKKDWGHTDVEISFVEADAKTDNSSMLQLESNMLGIYYFQVRKPPMFQYKNNKKC